MQPNGITDKPDPMPREPLVSVLMPVYNAERFVGEAVESILAQSYRNFEFIIVDDGSTDRSLEILKHYAAQDERIRLSSRPNAGIVVRLNEMLDEARSELIARMDADDVAMPDRFKHQVGFLLDNPDHVVVGSQVLVIDPDGDSLAVWCSEQTHEAIVDHLLNPTGGTVLCHPAVMCRRQPVVAVGKYRDVFAEDLDLFIRLAEHGGCVANLPLVLTKYRMHFKSSCHIQSTHLVDQAQETVRDARRRRGLPEIPTIKAEVSRPWDYRKKWGWWALTSGNVATARKYARQCLMHAPLSKETWRLVYCSIRGH
jgi:glycosyltransferase involved in cell wall biosynthesis